MLEKWGMEAPQKSRQPSMSIMEKDEKKWFEERVNWGMVQAFVPNITLPEYEGGAQLYLYGTTPEDLLENSVTLLPPPLSEVMNLIQQDYEMYERRRSYSTYAPIKLFESGVLMTLVTLEIAPYLMNNNLPKVSKHLSMDSFVPYVRAVSYREDNRITDVYTPLDERLSVPIVIGYGKYDGYRPDAIGLSAAILDCGIPEHEAFLEHQTYSFLSIAEFWDGQPSKITAYDEFYRPDAEFRGRISGPDHNVDRPDTTSIGYKEEQQ
jgi:hypothetical protein